MQPVEMAEKLDSQVLELKERLEMELICLGEEYHDEIRRRKEQHATEVRTVCANQKLACESPCRDSLKSKFFTEL